MGFLWVDDIANSNQKVQVVHFTCVVFGVSLSPFLLNATIDHQLKLLSCTNPELVIVLLRLIYVDDVVAGAVDADAALNLYKESKGVL